MELVSAIEVRHRTVSATGKKGFSRPCSMLMDIVLAGGKRLRPM